MNTTKQIKDMASRISAALESNWGASNMLDELRANIRAAEKQHRQGWDTGTARSGGRSYASISLAVDLFTVRTIADAVQMLTVKGRPRQLKKNVPTAALAIRKDYLLALRLVAEHLSKLFERNRCFSFTPAELSRVAALCDYTEVCCNPAGFLS